MSTETVDITDLLTRTRAARAADDAARVRVALAHDELNAANTAATRTYMDLCEARTAFQEAANA